MRHGEGEGDAPLAGQKDSRIRVGFYSTVLVQLPPLPELPSHGVNPLFAEVRLPLGDVLVIWPLLFLFLFF